MKLLREKKEKKEKCYGLFTLTCDVRSLPSAYVRLNIRVGAT